MESEIIHLSEKIVDIIYTPDQENLNPSFIQLMDLLMSFLSEDNLADERTVQVLQNMQKAFIKKDYGELADILHYDLCEKIKKNWDEG